MRASTLHSRHCPDSHSLVGYLACRGQTDDETDSFVTARERSSQGSVLYHDVEVTGLLP